MNEIIDQKFVIWIKEIKTSYHNAQIKAALHVNGEVIKFNYELGRQIHENGFKKQYGNKFFIRLSQELRKEIGNNKGFSPQNLRYFESFYILYKKIFYQVGRKLLLVPWRHHCAIMNKCKNNLTKALYFIDKTIQYGWSRAILLNHLTSDYEVAGSSVNNFKDTLEPTIEPLVNEMVKGNYEFSSVNLNNYYQEKDLQQALIKDINELILTFGDGFAFVGSEFRLHIGQTDLYPDLLFYNYKIHCFFVVELKITPFKNEYLGQLLGYVSAIDEILVNKEVDNKTVGVLICQDKDEVMIKTTLKNVISPVGVAKYEIPAKFPINKIRERLRLLNKSNEKK